MEIVEAIVEIRMANSVFKEDLFKLDAAGHVDHAYYASRSWSASRDDYDLRIVARNGFGRAYPGILRSFKEAVSDSSQRIRGGVRQTLRTNVAVHVGTARISVPGIHPSAETLEGLVAQHGNRVYQLAYRLTRSTADAEDILQDVFFKLYRNWVHISTCVNLCAWITRVVTNASIDLLRSRKSRAVIAGPASLAHVSGAGDSPSKALEEREFDEKLRAALDELPPREMAALVLFDHEGLKAREVGRILGLSEGAVRRYVFEGRRKVKEILTPYLRGDHP